jgi:hypothetical protein
VSGMRPRFHAGERGFGGVVGYPLDRLHEEMAFISYHFHWSRAEVMTLEHHERRRWVREISSINDALNRAP